VRAPTLPLIAVPLRPDDPSEPTQRRRQIVPKLCLCRLRALSCELLLAGEPFRYRCGTLLATTCGGGCSSLLCSGGFGDSGLCITTCSRRVRQEQGPNTHRMQLVRFWSEWLDVGLTSAAAARRASRSRLFAISARVFASNVKNAVRLPKNSCREQPAEQKTPTWCQASVFLSFVPSLPWQRERF
jgi:hypothetical protein